MKNETFYDITEIFSQHYGWECIEEKEKQKLLMYEKHINGKKVRINVYYKARTVHIQFSPKNQPVYKNVFDGVLEKIFIDPYKNPHESIKLPVRSKEKQKPAKMIPVLELIDKIDRLEKRVSDLEQALIDYKILNK